MLFNLPGDRVGLLPEDPAEVRREVQGILEREEAAVILALDASIPVQRLAEYLPLEHPFTVLLESGKWDQYQEQYQGIARVILRTPLATLRNRIMQFTRGSARAVMIDGQEFVALDMSA